MPIYEYKCTDCCQTSSILYQSLTNIKNQLPKCEHCGSVSLERIISQIGRIKSRGESDSGELRVVDPRKSVEGLSRQYDNAGIDPGRGFEEVAKQAASGKSPETLKEVIKEARKNETKNPSPSKTDKGKKRP
jgi:putative FmdB family regulatory protein